MSNEEVVMFILQTNKSQLIDLLQVSTANNELEKTIQKVINLMD